MEIVLARRAGSTLGGSPAQRPHHGFLAIHAHDV